MANSDALFNRVLSNGPSPATLFILLSEMKKQGQVKTVIQECIRALKSYPEDLHIRTLLAETYLEDGRVAQAEEEMNRVISLVEDAMGAYKIQAKIFSRQNRKPDAVYALNRYLIHRPEDQEAKGLLKDLKPFEAVPVSDRQPATLPGISPDVSIDQAPEPPADAKALEPLVFDEEDRPQIEVGEALVIEEAVPAPDIPDVEGPQMDEETAILEIVTPTLAEVYYEQGQLEKAIEIYEKVSDEAPEDEKSRRRLMALRAELTPLPADGRGEAKKGIVEKNKKLIAILESWLSNIRQMSDASVTATIR